MKTFILSCGPFGLVVVFLGLLILVLSVRKSMQMFGSRSCQPVELEQGLHAILFWGAISLVLGILGQCSGIYHAMGAISQATEISPQIILKGLGESYTSTIAGLVIFVFASVIWFALFTRYRKIVHQAKS